MAAEKDDIERYREGSLNEAARHALEKRALEDPFLADALEGSENINADEFSADIESLKKKIEKQKERNWFTPIRIAAGVVVLLSAGWLFYFYNFPQPDALTLENSSSAETADSGMNQHKDSSLLSLAKPDESAQAEEKTKPTTGQPKLDHLALTQKEIAAKSKTVPVQGEEGKEDVRKETETPTVAELADDKSEKQEEITESERVVSQPLQLSQRGAGISSKKESGTLRAMQSNDVLPQINISGRVTSAEDGSPIPGANVVIKGTRKGTTTDERGNFSISVNDPDQVLTVSFIGMKPAEVKTQNKSVVNVLLLEDTKQLSEVVITQKPEATDEIAEPTIKTATPIGGLKAYNKYLESNLKYPPQALPDKIKGKVIVQFNVLTDGSLSNFNVLKGLGHGCDEEVIRLVQEGPKWTPSTENDIAIESEVKVKMKFDPEKADKR